MCNQKYFKTKSNDERIICLSNIDSLGTNYNPWDKVYKIQIDYKTRNLDLIYCNKKLRDEDYTNIFNALNIEGDK